jgi:argininosuccinate synthase
MNHITDYKKIASYEPEIGKVDAVILLYSGGLDTSVMLTWIRDHYKAKVVALTLDIGQQKDDLEAIREKAIKLGAVKAIALDVRKEFAEHYISKGIKANASYQGDYHLSTPIGRAILATKAVEVAKKEGISCIAHGCTGKGNDQVRLEGYILAKDAGMKIIAPVREWNMDRDDEIAYAKEHGIPVLVHKDFPYSVDDNMWGMTWEGGEIEDPALVPPVEKFLTAYTLAEKSEKALESITLTFKAGIPVAVNGQTMELHTLIAALNDMGGAHGVGVAYMIEDRLVGVKDRGVYEQPGAHIIIEAHKVLERYVSTRELNEIKSMLDIKWGYLCYGAKWFDPAMDALNAFNEEVNRVVEGTVTLKLHKGNVAVVAVESPYGLQHASFNNKGYVFNVNASAGFTEIYTLQMKLANQLKKPPASPSSPK